MNSQQRPTAFITGGSSGIGAATAVALAEAGFDVAVNYRSNAEGAQQVAKRCGEAGASTLVLQGDVADDGSVTAMFEEIETTWGRLDKLVNNAGRTSDTPPSDLDGLSMEEWDAVFAVNVRGLFQVARAAVPLLRASDDAAIVNTASIVGIRPGPQPFPYAASKAAVVNLTSTLAGQLGPEIRVNAVAPGWIEGEWMEEALGEHYDKAMSKRAYKTPLKRVATFDDVAETVMSLLVSNHFVNGQTIVIDGGFTAVT